MNVAKRSEIGTETRIKLNKFVPRHYQKRVCDALENKNYKRLLVIWPRRAGKDVCAFNLMIRAALKRIGVYYYIFPSYSQARKVIWDSITIEGDRFLDYIPKELIKSAHIQEMKIQLVNGSLLQLVGSDNVDCYDDKTEILTENGWKLFDNLDANESVATLKDGYLSYDYPTIIVKKYYDGLMYRGLNNAFDFLVTPTHRWFVKSSKGFYKFKRTEELSLSGDSIPSTCKWDGIDKETFSFPVVENKWITGKGRLCHIKYTRTVAMEDFVALLGIFLAEGSTFKDHKTYRVTISQKKAHICEDIKKLLKRCSINYSYNQNNFCIQDRQLYEYFLQFGKQKDRFVPKEIKALSKKYLSILFEWLVKGDGSIQGDRISYYSSSRKLIDDVQEIVIKLGFSGNVSTKAEAGTNSYLAREDRYICYRSDLYQLLIRRSKYKRFASSKKSYISTQYYSGYVHCVSVPSGVIKVRRNGKEYWSGNSIVGTNPCGIIFSEYALQDPRAYQYLRPILLVNDGWALFISTVRGKNHLWEMYNIAINHPENWFVEKLTIEDTGHISVEAIEKEKEEGLMSEDLIMQEYYNDFTLGVEGAYYAKYIDKMRIADRIGAVPWEAGFKVHTAWDIGIRDSTAIIFFQNIGQTVRIIDFYENSKEGLEHYINMLQSKPYTYGKHIAPHDMRVREFGTGMTRVEKARQLGILFIIAVDLPITDGIEAVRSAFSKIWIDEKQCKSLIKSLENYRQEFDSKKRVYKNQPLHDIHSHAADAMRYLCITLPKTRDGLSAEDLNKRYKNAMYGPQSNMPAIFRDTPPF